MLQSKDHYKSSVPVFRKEKEVEIKSIQRILDSTVSFYSSIDRLGIRMMNSAATPGINNR